MSRAKGSPLFSEAETAKRVRELKKLSSKPDSVDWTDWWNQRQALERAQLAEKVRRAQARADDYLNGLLILVGNRGGHYLPFDEAFERSGSAELKKELAKCDTPANRRVLYTILRALTEVPKSWAMSAVTRFLRGTGAQKKAKYHGAGALGVRYGWKDREVGSIAAVIADGRNPYSLVLMSYADVAEENRQEAESEEELIPYGNTFAATRADRDVEFLNQLCGILETRGLADVPAPAAEKPKKERKVKVFKPGDVVRKNTLRDLPFPAHLRVTIEKQDPESKQFVSDTVEWVAFDIKGPYSRCYRVKDGVAYPSNRYRSEEYKSHLIGAVYLGKWEGPINESKKLAYKFYYRLPSQS